MPCEPYKNAIIEAAASGAELSGALGSHLDACPSCCATLAEEQQLFAAVDAGLHASANAEVPASLLPRVRARLDREAVAKRSWLAGRTVIAATAALIVLAITHQTKRPDAALQDPQKSTVAQKVSPAVVSVVPVEDPSGVSRHQRASKRAQPGTLEASASVEQVSVLLPPGQKEAVDDLLVSLQRGPWKGEVLLAENKYFQLEDLRIAPLDVSPLRVEPLADVSGESQSRSTDAKH